MKIDLSKIIGRHGEQNAALMTFLVQCFALAVCDGRVDVKFGRDVPRGVAARLNRNLQVAVRQSQHITAQQTSDSIDENPIYIIGFANDGPRFGSLMVDFSGGETTVIHIDLPES